MEGAAQPTQPQARPADQGAATKAAAGKGAAAAKAAAGKGSGPAGFDAAMHELRGQLVAEGLFRGSLWYYA